MVFNKKCGIAFVSIFLIEILIALYVHDNFIRPFFGDILVIILIYCFIKILFPVKSIFLPLGIFIFAVGVEIAQFFNLVKILGLQDNYFAKVVMGTVFDINDIVCYFIGFALLVVWQLFVDNKSR